MCAGTSVCVCVCLCVRVCVCVRITKCEFIVLLAVILQFGFISFTSQFICLNICKFRRACRSHTHTHTLRCPHSCHKHTVADSIHAFAAGVYAKENCRSSSSTGSSGSSSGINSACLRLPALATLGTLHIRHVLHTLTHTHAHTHTVKLCNNTLAA